LEPITDDQGRRRRTEETAGRDTMLRVPDSEAIVSLIVNGGIVLLFGVALAYGILAGLQWFGH
jgi:hypothetical protein